MIIPLEFEGMDVVKTLPNMFWEQQLAIDPEGPNGKKPHHQDASLFKVWNEKTHFLKKAADINPFGSDFFAWVDAGYFRRGTYVGSTMISRLPADLSDDQVMMLALGEDGVAAGFFGGFRPGINLWDAAFKSMLLRRTRSKTKKETTFLSKFERQKVSRYCTKAKKISKNDCYKFVGKEQITMAMACQEHPQLCYLVRPPKHYPDPW
eukprot:CAMPEP_0168739050 /NCGR_PEP_ID=MMETSP0724-20121128/11253_1 /TAXON_ID=265536 /ORGANISM="Amphiprora sp., Strain CCMP467" /LENGTH=206 /DNA_ID=CAMNT_0008786421 /DNA_START=313 /DNA_END=930 /DNA_ORIENTATION=-